jgi:hypothetical protein
VFTAFVKGAELIAHEGAPAPLPPASPVTGVGVTVYHAPGDQVQFVAIPVPQADPPVLESRPLNLGKLVQFYDWAPAGRYSRFIRNMVWSNTDPSGNDIQITSHTRSGYKLGGVYSLTVKIGNEGAPITLATMTVPAGTVRQTFQNVNLSAIPNGWHLFDIVVPDDATVHPFWMHVGPPTVQTWAPVQTGSFGVEHEDGPVARWGKVPVQLDQIVAQRGYPLPPRQWLPMAGHPAATALYKRDLVPSINGDPPYLHTLSGGIKTCLNAQGYAWTSFIAKLPAVVPRDGPRGVGLVSGATHLQIGRRGGIYGLDCWRMFHVEASGYVRTLLGWREGDNGLELVGDWSAIPAERHGLHESWGLTWDSRTIAESALDTSLLLDRGDGVMEHPHSVGPVAFIADTQNRRVLRVQFDPRSHDTPPKVTEFITGLNDPWDVVYHKGRILVSERLSHRIAAYDATTGAYIETLVQGAALCTLDKSRFVVVSGTLEQRRADPCVGPEGLFVVGDWLYYGSRAAQRVRRIHLVTRAIEVVCDPYFDTSPAGSQFCKLAVRKDGTVFVSTWENVAKGGPRAHRPDGTAWSIQSGASTHVREGRGGLWSDIGYSTAAAVDDFRVLYSGADYGLAEISLALPSDPPAFDKTIYAQGKAEYETAGHRLTHGIDGFGQFGYALPWGKSAAMDHYLAAQGHQAAA